MSLALLATLVLTASAPQQVALPPDDASAATVKFAFRAGSVDDPDGREGLTALTAELLVRSDTLERELYPLGASIDVQSDREQVVFTATAPRASIAQVGNMLADALVHPQLDAESLDGARQDALTSLRQLQADPEALAREALMQVLFPNHPYARPVLGTPRGLAAITVDDERAQLARVFTRDRLTIGVAGGYPPSLPSDLQRALASLPEHGAQPVNLPAPSAGPRVLIVERPGASTAIFLGTPLDVRRGDPDWAPLAVGVSALGEHRQFGGRLISELREQRGLNYGAYAYVERFVQDGDTTYPAPHVALRQQYFSLWVRPVEHHNALFALRAAVHVVQQLVDHGVGDDELARTRAFLQGATRLWAQTDARQLGWALDGAFYGDAAFLEHHRAALGKVTRAQVDAALRKHLDPRALRMVIVTTDAQALRRELLGGAPTPPRYAGVPPAHLAEADRHIAALDLGLRADEVEIANAESIFEK